MTVTAITSLAQFKEIINSGKPVLIDFWATWCGPCRTIDPIFQKFSQDPAGVGFYKVDVDAQPDISQEAGVKAMPTFMLFKNGEKKDELPGAYPSRLQDLVKQAQSLV